MRIILSTLLLSFCFLGINAQSQFNAETLSVSKSELEQNVFSKDSTANALVIHETGNTYVDRNDFKINHIVNRKLKILNREGFEHATQEVVLYNNTRGRKERIEDIQATVYNLENGNIVKTKLF